ncbi:MAG: YbjQ family protein [Candidatus Marinimicrobia bacterium]|nr:YbjQ family protein [Candidatus Neomarinimicrobiota bacterium]
MVNWYTTETVAGKEIKEHIGVATGSTIRARNIGRDIVAGLRTIVGGEVPEYTEMMAHSRNQAVERMLQKAVDLDADAVVCVRFSTAMIMQGTAEVMAFGTAVKFK